MRTPSLVSDVLLHRFDIRSPLISGRLRFERTTQTLHYDLQIEHGQDQEIVDVKLHRGDVGSNGPIIELLGEDLQGSVPIRNEHVDDLLQDRLYLLVYTQDAPAGAIRGQIVRH